MENETDLFEFLGYESIDDFIKSDFGKKRSKRKPTEKTLEQIHDTWRRTEERADKRYKKISEFIDVIVKEVPKNARGYHIVYFEEKEKYNGVEKTVLYQYSFSYDSGFKSYAYSNERVNLPGGNTVEARDARLEFLLSNTKAFELGDQFRKLKKIEPRKQYFFRKKFTDIINEKLREKYKDSRYDEVENITIVEVSGKKYYFLVDEQHRHTWKVFHYKGEVKEDNIFKL